MTAHLRLAPFQALARFAPGEADFFSLQTLFLAERLNERVKREQEAARRRRRGLQWEPLPALS